MTNKPGLRLALDIALGEHIDGDEWLQQRTREGASLRTLASEVSEILGQTVSHAAIDRWLAAIRDERAAA